MHTIHEDPDESKYTRFSKSAANNESMMKATQADILAELKDSDD